MAQNHFNMKNSVVGVLVLVFTVSGCNRDGGGGNEKPAGPLPSWADGANKKAILAFVKLVTDSSGAGYVPVGERIATFDNDGTLWAEKPLVQELFSIWQAKQMIGRDSQLVHVQPFKAIAEGDKKYFAEGGEKALIQLVLATHTGTTEGAFERSVADFVSQATVNGRPLRQTVYQPQLELLDLLRANGFTLYICTGGTVEVVRSVSESLYGIPKERVIGTSFKYQFVDSTGQLMRLAAIDHFNDKAEKPAGIQLHIGRRPIFACGNVGGAGDIEMLKFSRGSRYPSFQLLINHDDSTREYYYQEKDNGSLHAALDGHWHVVSMHNDWLQVFQAK
jgi:hypothetical protein